jgi:hypothetical protein
MKIDQASRPSPLHREIHAQSPLIADNAIRVLNIELKNAARAESAG